MKKRDTRHISGEGSVQVPSRKPSATTAARVLTQVCCAFSRHVCGPWTHRHPGGLLQRKWSRRLQATAVSPVPGGSETLRIFRRLAAHGTQHADHHPICRDAAEVMAFTTQLELVCWEQSMPDANSSSTHPSATRQHFGVFQLAHDVPAIFPRSGPQHASGRLVLGNDECRPPPAMTTGRVSSNM